MVSIDVNVDENVKVYKKKGGIEDKFIGLR